MLEEDKKNRRMTTEGEHEDEEKVEVTAEIKHGEQSGGFL